MDFTPLERAKQMAAEQGLTFDDAGRIEGLGKFEGETLETVYWYTSALDGDGEPIYGATEHEHDEPDYLGNLFDIDTAEREAFEIAPGFVAAFLTHSDQGFVALDYLTAEQVATLRGETL